MKNVNAIDPGQCVFFRCGIGGGMKRGGGGCSRSRRAACRCQTRFQCRRSADCERVWAGELLVVCGTRIRMSVGPRLALGFEKLHDLVFGGLGALRGDVAIDETKNFGLLVIA